MTGASDRPLVEIDGLAKSFPRVFKRADRVGALWQLLRGHEPAQRNPVLDDISLTIQRGESLGVIGENGAGKSTLLKLITGVLAPTRGRAALNGSVGALLELGAGFHPEYTGRDNISLAGTLMGMSPREIAAATPGIIEFADIGDYIDEPVKHYSSGMVVRLGFAMVASRRPDLLITDEVLAVGDEAFQRKCVRWIEEYLAGGGTLMLVAHGMYHVQKLCSRALWLHEGRVAAYGDVFDVTQRYLAYLEQRTARDQSRNAATVAGEFRIDSVALDGDAGLAGIVLEGDADLTVEIVVESKLDRVPVVGIGIVRADGTAVYGVSTDIDGVDAAVPREGRLVYTLTLDALPLLPGSYQVRAHVLDPEGVRLFDTQERPLVVRGRSRELGLVRIPHRWSAR